MIESGPESLRTVSIEEIKDVCFSIPLKDQECQHSALLEKLADFFICKGFLAEREWPVTFNHHHRTWNMPLTRHGFIDLVATDGCGKIAVEFDTGNVLKLRSIEKLLDCDAQLVIGIAGTRCAAPRLQMNIKRIAAASDYTKRENKEMWIILLAKKVAQKAVL